MSFAAEIGVAFAGVALTAWGGWKLKRTQDFEGWPQSRARITQVVLRSDGDGRCFLEFEGTYEVNGASFSHVRLSPMGAGLAPHEAATLREQALATDGAWVRYNPSDPSVAYISNRGDETAFTLVAIGIAFVLIAAIRFVWFL